MLNSGTQPGPPSSAHLADGLISCPFFSHLMGALGSATSTDSWIFLPLSTEYAGSSFLRKAGREAS